MVSLTHPREVVFITSRAELMIIGKKLEKDNITLTTWHMPIALNPRIYAVSLSKNRFSNKLINESKVFCVNLVPKTFEKYAHDISSTDGTHTDKFAEHGLKKEECESIDCCRINDASGYLECEVIEQHEFGDHILYIGKVVNSILNKTGKRLFQITEKKFTTTI